MSIPENAPQWLKDARTKDAEVVIEMRGCMKIVIDIKRFMRLNPSIKTVRQAKKLIKAIRATPHETLEEVIAYNKRGEV